MRRMNHDPTNIIKAVAKAANRTLDIKEAEDRLTVHKGCYILGTWGVDIRYGFNHFIKGPYSEELADDIDEIGSIDLGTDAESIPPIMIQDLSEIFGKGPKYTEAYSILLLVKNNNPRTEYDWIRNRAIEIRPNLKDEFMEASLSLLV